ncbi:hypothetical protein BJ508DRAFT_373146 [Ascobolus immersus RN42]|uniref:SH3 domain-containing protein n=1 Tax=Ascobolus immersus RN42 TaxID=1160509 RepID=A0A3N4IWE3_ASCIM|nr:hypothetical protein BJ508DRAFT_373146 [Ascobolus immersus RN42]
MHAFASFTTFPVSLLVIALASLSRTVQAQESEEVAPSSRSEQCLTSLPFTFQIAINRLAPGSVNTNHYMDPALAPEGFVPRSVDTALIPEDYYTPDEQELLELASFDDDQDMLELTSLAEEGYVPIDFEEDVEFIELPVGEETEGDATESEGDATESEGESEI